MTLQRRRGLGITLSADFTGGTNYAVIGSVVDGLDHGGAKADVADLTILADTYKQKLNCQIDAGEVQFKIASDPNDANYQAVAAAMVPSYVVPNWQITYPAVTGNTTATENFSGQVSGMGRKIATKDLIISPITITITGTPGFA